VDRHVASGAGDGIRFRILGTLQARAHDGTQVQLSARKPRTLLAVLLLHANQPVGTDRLTELLWPGGPPRSANGALRTYVSTLRTIAGSAVVAVAPGYRLDVPTDDLDALLFERLAVLGGEAAARGEHAAAADLLQRALDLWRGPPLDGIPFDAAAELVITDLAERRLTVLEDWAESRLALGGHAEVVAALRGVAADQPVRERLHGLVMLALYRAGRQADALAAFRRLRYRLVEELGIEPAPALQALQRQILSGDPALDPRGGDLVGGVAVPRQLPPDLSSFVGRAHEVRAGPGGRILAIDGAGGVGKSTLAVHIGYRLASMYPDGQLYVDLQGATAGLRPLDPLEVLGRFRRALGDTDTASSSLEEASAAFRALAAGRRLLVVLDNARDAVQVRPLLPADENSLVLVTSRQVLATLDGAVHLHVDVFPEDDAVELLCRVAGRDRVSADPYAARQVARWCGYLPLALRIAGARLAARPGWPVRALVDRLGDARRRLDELRVAELAVRSSLQVSYEILNGGTDADRLAARAFTLVGLPDGPDLSLPAAAALLDLPEPAAERVMERLVDCQLVESPWPGRYRLHDLLRLLGRELAPADAAIPALTRMLSWYVATAWQAFRLLRPGDPRSAGADTSGGMPFATADAALDWLESERANLVAAVQQVATTPDLPGEPAVQLARALFAYFHIRSNIGDWIDVNEAARTVARRTGDRLGEAYACRDLGAVREICGQYRQAAADLRDGLELFGEIGDRRGHAACLNNLGAVHDSLGEPARAAELLERSLAVSRELGDQHSAAISLNNLGPLYERTGDHLRALACLREALDTWRRLGNRRGEAVALAHLAGAHAGRAAYAEALECSDASLALFQELDDALGRAYALSRRGAALRGQGRYALAEECLRDAQRIGERVGDRRLVAACLRELGVTAHMLGQHERARVHWHAALSVYEKLGVADAEEIRALLAGWERRPAASTGG
jgi:DNA-binding SARP family transcriptional activator